MCDQPERTFKLRSMINHVWYSITYNYVNHIMTKRIKITYKGITYNSVTELAKAFNINHNTLRSRLKNSNDLPEVLENPAGYKRRTYNVSGITFTKLDDIVDHFKLRSGRFYRILKLSGYDYDNLDLIVAKADNVIQDHKGIRYKTYADMARSYGITESMLAYRLNAGKSIEDALTKGKYKR